MNKSLLLSKICTVSLKKNIAFVKLLELSLGSDIFTSFTDFQSRGMGNFDYIWVQTFEIYIQGCLLLQ